MPADLSIRFLLISQNRQGPSRRCGTTCSGTWLGATSPAAIPDSVRSFLFRLVKATTVAQADETMVFRVDCRSSGTYPLNSKGARAKRSRIQDLVCEYSLFIISRYFISFIRRCIHSNREYFFTIHRITRPKVYFGCIARHKAFLAFLAPI